MRPSARGCICHQRLFGLLLYPQVAYGAGIKKTQKVYTFDKVRYEAITVLHIIFDTTYTQM